MTITDLETYSQNMVKVEKEVNPLLKLKIPSNDFDRRSIILSKEVIERLRNFLVESRNPLMQALSEPNIGEKKREKRTNKLAMLNTVIWAIDNARP